jgi:hypothetical protein
LFHPKSAAAIEGIEAYQNLRFPITVYTATIDDICSIENVEAFWRTIKSKKELIFNGLIPLISN